MLFRCGRVELNHRNLDDIFFCNVNHVPSSILLHGLIIYPSCYRFIAAEWPSWTTADLRRRGCRVLPIVEPVSTQKVSPTSSRLFRDS